LGQVRLLQCCSHAASFASHATIHVTPPHLRWKLCLFAVFNTARTSADLRNCAVCCLCCRRCPSALTSCRQQR
jgi:hypothetical protein